MIVCASTGPRTSYFFTCGDHKLETFYSGCRTSIMAQSGQNEKRKIGEISTAIGGYMRKCLRERLHNNNHSVAYIGRMENITSTHGACHNKEIAFHHEMYQAIADLEQAQLVLARAASTVICTEAMEVRRQVQTYHNRMEERRKALTNIQRRQKLRKGRHNDTSGCAVFRKSASETSPDNVVSKADVIISIDDDEPVSSSKRAVTSDDSCQTDETASLSLPLEDISSIREERISLMKRVIRMKKITCMVGELERDQSQLLNEIRKGWLEQSEQNAESLKRRLGREPE
jgi:hypothetical protein